MGNGSVFGLGAKDNNKLRDADFDPTKDVGIASSAFASLRRELGGGREEEIVELKSRICFTLVGYSTFKVDDTTLHISYYILYFA